MNTLTTMMPIKRERYDDSEDEHFDDNDANKEFTLEPPMVVYKALNIYENWTQEGPVGTKYASSQSGWFDMNLFEVWFFKILLTHIEATRQDDDKVVVVGDNLVCHFSPKVIQVIRSLWLETIWFAIFLQKSSKHAETNLFT
ncbi:DDE superfamily endonuclease [Popillia japonica]|uniref:DDE superfamily endonuclease n=1 Tax=Popillia japonica TaxID=7064 RepID=A0AAW1LQL4_POPJA